MFNAVRAWRTRGAGWRTAAIVIILQSAAWVLDKAATVLFEHVMKSGWIEGAVSFLSAVTSDRFTLGVLVTSAIVLCAPYLVHCWNLLYDKRRPGSQEAKHNEGALQTTPHPPQVPKFDQHGPHIGAPTSNMPPNGLADAPVKPRPAYDRYENINEFHLWEAACLWAEIEPALPLSPHAAANLRKLKMAVVSRWLETRTLSSASRTLLFVGITPSTRDISDNEIVTRRQLVIYADCVKERPAFLFR